MDMAVVHSSYRLCIHLATMSREKEENSRGFNKRPCKCTRGPKFVYHIYVRERGRFWLALREEILLWKLSASSYIYIKRKVFVS